MSAKLSRQIDKRFGSPSDFEEFFGKEATKKIRIHFDVREHPITGTPSESCKTNLFFGFFFDGTKNNYKLAEAEKNHSNVARLYDCYPGLSVPGVLPKATDWQNNPERYSHFFKVYVPGVASPFPQVNDSGDGWKAVLGGVGGAFAERRIIWALVQAINNVHRYFLKTPLVSQPELDRLLDQIVLNKQARALMGRSTAAAGAFSVGDANMRAGHEFAKLLLRLHSAVSKHWPDARTGKPAKIDPAIVKTIYVSTFGFSRGATEARAFANWFHSLCKLDAQLSGKAGGMTLGGFNVEFDFLGVFDTVASVGLGNTLGNTLFGRNLNGHGAWADSEDSLRVPAGVKCLHLVAAHELRRSFPVDSISVKGILPEGCEEIVVPGVHSDVGCGYRPSEQGRGTDRTGADMLPRIPLLMMYRAARLSGVPLKLEMASAVAKERFALQPEAIQAFNAYIATCKETAGPIHQIMREQARKQIEWRLLRRVTAGSPIQKSSSFLRASTLDQNDLYSAALEFEEEIAAFKAWLKDKGTGFRPVAQRPGFDNDAPAEWEEIARWWDEAPQPSADVMRFFDDYVHDSRASFKLNSDPTDEKGMHALLGEWVKKRKAAQERAQQQAKVVHPVLAGKADYRTADSKRISTGDGLTVDQRRAADEYAKTGTIPRMRTTGRESSGSAGYLRFRKIYGGWDSELLSSVQKPVNDGGEIAHMTPRDRTSSASA
jgi:hypothetical protein